MNPGFYRCTCLALLLLASRTYAADALQRPAIEPSVVLEQFDVDVDGDALLVPVTFHGTKYLFALDTGSSMTAFDPSLEPHLGKPAATAKFIAGSGEVHVKLYPLPEASVGKLKLITTERQVAVADLKAIRKGCGHDVRGIIGMDFLKDHVVAINFDTGKLTFLKAVSAPPPGRSVPISFDELGLPHINVELPSWGEERFLVDTGLTGFGSCDLRGSLFEVLRQRKAVDGIRRGRSQWIATVQQSRFGFIEGMQIAGFAHGRMRCSEASENSVGLGFLLRYNVTFDFPNQRLYLTKSTKFDRADQVDMSGLHLVRKDGRTIVESIEKESPADLAGIKPRDEIRRINDQESARTTLLGLERLLRSEGARCRLTFQRGDVVMNTTIVLRDYQHREKITSNKIATVPALSGDR